MELDGQLATQPTAQPQAGQPVQPAVGMAAAQGQVDPAEKNRKRMMLQGQIQQLERQLADLRKQLTDIR